MCATARRRSGAPILIVLLTLELRLPPAVAAAQATDCTGYDSQVWAQSIHATDSSRCAALDPDGDGRACEEPPPGADPAWWTPIVPARTSPPIYV